MRMLRPAYMLRRSAIPRIRVLLGLLLILSASANASVAFLMEESYGVFGAFSPTGHAAIYLNHVCAATPTELRLCRAGEYGVVLSRYHKIDGYDWIAMPLIPYLYAVETPAEVPATATREQETALRDAYRRAHLEDLAPDTRKGKAPGGAWVQLAGSSYDRTIHGFQLETTAGQDQRFIALFNDRKDLTHFNLLFQNCADFSRVTLDLYFPHSISRNLIADIGLTTPKQVARSFIAYGARHPELRMTAFLIPQVAGSIPRSHPVDGIAESLLKSKKYLLPLAFFSPEVTGGVVVAFLAEGRMKLPRDAAIFNLNDERVGRGEPAPADSSTTGFDPPPVVSPLVPAAAAAPGATVQVSPIPSS